MLASLVLSLLFLFCFNQCKGTEGKGQPFKAQECSKQDLCINKRFTRCGGRGLTRWEKLKDFSCKKSYEVEI